MFFSFFKRFLPFLCSITLFSTIFLLISTSCTGRESYKSDNGIIWNTTFHITYQSSNSLTDSIFAVLEDVGKSLSVFDESSIVSNVNNSDSASVDSHFILVYETSKRINSISEGMFDPTVSPLVTAWGFGKGHAVSSDTARIDSILKFVGINKTLLKGNMIKKDDPRIQFNFSAIAKGYGCDAVAAMLKRNGINNYLVEIGGEIAASGVNSKGKSWKISIDRPITGSLPGESSQEVIEIENGCVATSGNYRNFHTSGKESFGHTISPVTGRPVATDIISATVVAPSAMEADALATAIVASGKRKTMDIYRRSPHPILIVMNDSSVWKSKEFKALESR